jgi:subtilisin family serine protease
MTHKTAKHIFLGAALFAGLNIFTACNSSDMNVEALDQVIKADDKNGMIIPDQYIIRFKNNDVKGFTYKRAKENVLSEATAMLANYSIGAEAITQTYGATIKGFAATLSEAQVANLRNNSDIIIEPNRIITLGKPGSGGGGTSPTQETPWGITRVGGATSGISGTAWVLDSGIDLDHADLNVDVARSRSFIASGKDARNADDGNGHGTHCAGTIAAIDNGIGVVGVAAGATVVAVKVLDSNGSGDYAGVIAGVDYVASAGSPGDVASMSLGGPASPALDNAILAASARGIYFALAAGNEAQNAANVSPARINGTFIYTVSAIDINDRFASFSNFGNPPVDVAAPGVAVKSTWKGGGYNTISGTSMATPHVAGLLLVTGGNLATDGNALNDPDGNADPIAHK